MVECKFLETLSLRALISPITKDDFRTRYWEQQPLVVHRANPGFYGDLFTLQDFDEAIERHPDYVKTANAETKKNLSFKTNMAPGLEATLDTMREGSTLVIDQLHNHDPKLAMLCRMMAADLGHKFQVNLYLTPAGGKGFSPHWDNHDVFILQVLGSKHWKIEKERRCFPARLERMGDEGRELRGDLLSFTLEQGDLIYIPRGYVHAAECSDSPSLHITLGVTAQMYEDFLVAAVKALMQQDPGLKYALPLGFMDGTQDALIQRAAQGFRAAADRDFLVMAFDQYRDELVQKYQLDVSGQVEEFFNPRPLNLDDKVGRRPGVVYRMHPADDSVRLNFGARSITFPGFFREALEYALSIHSFRIRDLPGEIEDEERVVFIERLIQEGLVVRN